MTANQLSRDGSLSGMLVPIIMLACLLCGGCTAEVGSERWCDQVSRKPKSDWTADEIKSYVSQCLFGPTSE